MAANIANVVSRSFVIFDLEQQLAELRLKYGEKHQIVMQLKDYIDKMTNDLTVMSLPFVEAIGPASVKIIEQAQVPFIPVGHSKRMTVVLAFFMSICAGIMLTFGFEYLDHTFKSPKDVETFLNLPLLGSIQKKGFKDNILIDYSRCITAFSQSYQNISDQIYLLLKDKRLKSILITAASPSDGSSTIIANLSNYLSNKAGHKVIVVDTNLRSPTIHKIFNLSDTTGLANVLENKIPLNNAIYQISSNLAVLPAGNTALNPVTLLESSMMHDVIKTIHNTYEVVIVDYANLSNIKEVYALSSYLDGIVLVVNEGKTRHHVIKTLIAPFRQKKANLIGVILNKRNYVVPRLLYERI
jgi:capsular exopolysaccharide synthesis family protein